jgi:NADH-quinone oxidoreductase subunit L
MPEIFSGNLGVSHWLHLADQRFFVPHTQEIFLMSINTLFTLAVIVYTYKKYAYTDAIVLEKRDGMIANKFYIDAFYAKTVVTVLEKLSSFFDKKISQSLIDGTINSMAVAYLKIGNLFARAENGNVRFYALYMLIGLVSGFVYLYWSLRSSL